MKTKKKEHRLHASAGEGVVDNPSCQKESPHGHCLNCGAELQGIYCHECGQHASNQNLKVKGFILEYLNNAYIFDSKLLQTLGHLIMRPGYLTNEFLSGKIVRYEHPLKLNMFFLFVFITLFLLFSDTQKVEASFDEVAKDELVLPFLALSSLSEDQEYAAKMQQSPRDTVKLMAPLAIAEDYPAIIKPVRVIVEAQKDYPDIYLASVPKVLVDDMVLVGDNKSGYRFNGENDFVNQKSGLNLVNIVWAKIVGFLTQYFPMIVLLTSPFLSLAVRLMHRKPKFSSMHHFVFSLHYTAFMELLLLFVYLSYLIFNLSSGISKWVMIVASCLYLTIALRRVYGCNSWLKSLVKAFLISFVYLVICSVVFIFIIIVATILVSTSKEIVI